MQTIQQQKEFFEAMKGKLPAQYAKEISARLMGISISQVKCVFKGEITNAEILRQVKEKAEEIAQERETLFALNNSLAKKPKRKMAVTV